MSLQDPPYKIVLERSATFQHYYLMEVYPLAPLTVTIKPLLEEEIRRLIENEGYEEFLVGNQGRFDAMVYRQEVLGW